MPLDGNGTYAPPAPEFPAIPNTTILASDFNAITLDIAAALSNAIYRDGQAPFVANQSMGGFKLTAVGKGSANDDSVNFEQVFFDPTFTSTTGQKVVVTGETFEVAADTFDVTSNIVNLPGATTIGAVTPTEINYLSGLTGNIQAQLNDKVADQGGTATDLTILGTSTAPTQPSGDSSTKLANTFFVQQVAMNAALPNQVNNAGKYLGTDGTDASWLSLKGRIYFSSGGN